VAEGEYFLSCLPLKISGVEASPVRAVLVKE
jgi:arylformamidase